MTVDTYAFVHDAEHVSDLPMPCKPAPAPVAVASASASTSTLAAPAAPRAGGGSSGALAAFLHECRVDKGNDHTHTSLAAPAGLYYLSQEQHDTFHRLYKAAMQRGEDLHITEHHRHIGPVVVDLDFRFQPTYEDHQQGERAGALRRRYTDADVTAVVGIYCRHLAQLVQLPAAGVDVYVTEKRGASLFKGVVKDGLHLVFPSVVTRPAVQLLLRNAVLRDIEAALAHLTLFNRIEDVVDEAVIERNNWMLYGSKKKDGEAYAVTRRYTCTVRPMADPEVRPVPLDPALAPTDYVELLSIRNKHDETPTRPERQEQLDTFLAQREEVRRRKQALETWSANGRNDDASAKNESPDFELAAKLVAVLSPHRAESYDDWIRLGLCLRNIDHRLLEAWVTFSQQSPKYTPGECPRKWAAFSRKGTIGMGTLRMWARLDNPDKYREALRNDLYNLFLVTMSGTHYDVAKVVHYMFSHRFVCASTRSRVWYEFRNHRWHKDEGGIVLYRLLSEDVFTELHYFISLLHQQVATLYGDDGKQAQLSDAAKRIACVADRLKTSKFKEDVMKEAGTIFLDKDFEGKLDANTLLLGVDNGILDFSVNPVEFRDGRPEDYVSNSTGNMYVPYHASHPDAPALTRVFEQIHTDPEVRAYVLTMLASCLVGNTKDQKFYIWTGYGGANGKSICTSMMEAALGANYCCKLPVTLLTQKRAASGAAQPEVARARGKRFAVLQEPSEDEKLNVGLMKELSGLDKIVTRGLYQECVEWRPQFRLVLCCNNLPAVPSDDGGTWRRIRLVEFKSKFTDRPDPANPNEFPIDLELGSRLEGWGGLFLSWMVDVWYPKYAAGNMREPESVLQCTREYQRANDFMAEFMDACLEKHDASYLCFTDIMSALREWSRQDAVASRIKRPDVKSYMDRALGRPVSHKGKHLYKGWRVRKHEEGDDDFPPGDAASDDDDDELLVKKK